MLSIVCPVTGCTYTMGDVDAKVAVALLGLHAVDHNTLPTQTATKVEKVKPVRTGHIFYLAGQTILRQQKSQIKIK